MKTYTSIAPGSWNTEDGKMSIPNDPMNSDRIRMLKEIAAGEAVVVDYVAPPPEPAPLSRQELEDRIAVLERKLDV